MKDRLIQGELRYRNLSGRELTKVLETSTLKPAEKIIAVYITGERVDLASGYAQAYDGHIEITRLSAQTVQIRMNLVYAYFPRGEPELLLVAA